MTFIISNEPLPLFRKIGDIYLKGDYIKKDSHFLIFEGIIYPENEFNKVELLNKIIGNGTEYLTHLKGYFCGIYYNLKENQLYFFTDKFGHYDLFYYKTKKSLIISNTFNEIILNKKFNLDDVDPTSLSEFIFFEYPLFEKTFIKTIKFVPIGTIFIFDLNENTLKKNQYFDYKFDLDPKINVKNGIEKLEELFNNAIEKIKKLNPPNTVFGLGLSGGMDSRVTAYYALKNNLKLKTYIFGEENSDAYHISRKIAKALRLDHYELGFKKDFFKYSEKIINYNPMMNVLYSWYYANYKELPGFDVLLTGYNGDNQFGSHLNKSDLLIKNDEDFSKSIIKKYCKGNVKQTLKFFNDFSIFFKINKRIINFSKNSLNPEFWEKKEEFNYKYRQRILIKNNPSLNFLDLFKSFSIFIDPDLLEFLMKIPVKLRLNRRLFYEFLKRKIPILFKIRAERKVPIYLNNKLLNFILKTIRYYDVKYQRFFIFKKSHKSVEKWISGNKNFIRYLNKILLEDNSLFFNLINQNKIMNLISKRIWNSYEISLLFRFLTIKLFLDKLKE